MPDSFTDIAKVTRLNIPSHNVPARLNIARKANAGLRGSLGVADGTLGSAPLGGGPASTSDPPRKRGRPRKMAKVQAQKK